MPAGRLDFLDRDYGYEMPARRPGILDMKGGGIDEAFYEKPARRPEILDSREDGAFAEGVFCDNAREEASCPRRSDDATTPVRRPGNLDLETRSQRGNALSPLDTIECTQYTHGTLVIPEQ